MPKRTPPVEWYIAESDTEWQRLCEPSTPAPLGSQHRLAAQRFLGSVALLCLLAGAWWWHANQAGVQQKAAAVQAPKSLHQTPVAPADDWLRRPGPEVSGSYQAVKNMESPVYVFEAAQPLTVQGDHAWSRIVMYTDHGKPAYRQTRFYRRTAGGWQQAEPDAALWGAAGTLETPSFVYYFRLNDAQVVTKVAGQIEVLYTTLRDNFGLMDIPRGGQPITPAIGQKLAIEVSVTQRLGSARFEPHNYERFVWADRIIVASPALYLAPVERTDAELLAQSVALPLLAHVLAQAGEEYQLDATWQPLVNGLHLWQVWDLDLPLATWQEEVVTWVYTDLPNSRSGQTAVLPEHYTALCASHQLWLPSPVEMNIPLVCAEGVQEDFFLSPWGWYHPLTRLEQLAVPLPSEAYIEEMDALRLASHPGRTVALATLIEYAVATYGRERLPALLAGLGQHKSWATLLPAVYGVSPGEFEAGWQAYLAERYGVSVTNK